MEIDWLTPEATGRGSVIVVGGRGERADVYNRFARRIAFDGYRVAVVENDPDTIVRAIAGAQVDLSLTVVGSDSGALVALSAAVAHPAVTGVVVAGLLVADPEASAQDWDEELDTRSACPVHRGVLSSADALEPGSLTHVVPIATAEILAQVDVPVLVIHGQSDVLSPAPDVLALSSSLRDARVVVVRDGRHDILNDVSHRSVAAEIVQFLERLRLPDTPDIILRDPVGIHAA